MNDEGDARRSFRMGFSARPLKRIEPAVRALAQCVRAQKPAR
jgi:GntR family transcriptional regulator/MocR family aminotransferase